MRSIRHRPEALAGVAATSVVLGGSKWGSYIGVSPVFLTDILLAAAFVHYAVTRLRNVERFPNRVAFVHPILVLLLGWTLMRFLITPAISVDAFRDAAPYLYAGAGIAAAASLNRATYQCRLRTARIIELALYFHATWVFLSVIAFPHFYLHLPHISRGRPEHFLEPRPDIDEALSGIAAALLLLRVFRGKQWRLALIGFALCWWTIIIQESRAGQIGAALVTVFAASVGLLGTTIGVRVKLGGLALLPIVVVLAAMTLPQTTAFARLQGTFGFGNTDASVGAHGTTSARTQSWNVLYDWDLADTTRSIVGVGFGRNFMEESGAERVLTGSEQQDGPRSPHNYWLGTYSRLGLPGVALFGALLLVVIGTVLRNRRRIVDDPLLAVVTLIPAGMILPATVGVVLEAPFGAVPFFWAVGILLASLGSGGVWGDATVRYPAHLGSSRTITGENDRRGDC